MDNGKDVHTLLLRMELEVSLPIVPLQTAMRHQNEQRHGTQKCGNCFCNAADGTNAFWAKWDFWLQHREWTLEEKNCSTAIMEVWYLVLQRNLLG